MADYKKIIAGMALDAASWDAAAIVDTLVQLEDSGADALFVMLPQVGAENPEHYFALIKEIGRAVDLPLWVGAPTYRLEDVKKFLYAGATVVLVDQAHEAVYAETVERFGMEKCQLAMPFSMITDAGAVPGILAEEPAVFLDCSDMTATPDLFAVKQACTEQGVPVNRFVSAISWNQFKLNDAGLIPVIVQDYKTDEVLMMAYMNEESFAATCASGRMTYYSRSRKQLWLKGETSGHFQYVKSLTLDCDNDTILAKVKQVGAACHTGARSCFFQPLVKKEYTAANPLQVFEHVYSVIEDRKRNPKEGSYTNYLFNKGIDKILKKVGEEATEIVIAAKNSDAEEIKYEIADFLYHTMVLMVERGVTWEDITKELANRE